MNIARWSALSALWSVSALGCSDPSSGSPPSPPHKGEYVSKISSNLEGRAIDMGGEHTHVELRHSDGKLVFAADYQGAEKAYQVDHTLYSEVASGTDAAPTMQHLTLERAPGQTLTLDSAVDGTFFAYSQMVRSVSGEYAAQDNYGCDTDPTGRTTFSCSKKGVCCDQHDACYAKNGCKANSWGASLSSVCQRACNLPVAGCTLFSNPGPSVCCTASPDEACGLPRPTTNVRVAEDSDGGVEDPALTGDDGDGGLDDADPIDDESDGGSDDDESEDSDGGADDDQSAVEDSTDGDTSGSDETTTGPSDDRDDSEDNDSSDDSRSSDD
jgi:hypothetical protein